MSIFNFLQDGIEIPKITTEILTLLIFVVLDYILGMIVSIIFHKSKNNKIKGLNSNYGWKGLIKKGSIFAIVLVANRLDEITGLNIIQNYVIMSSIINELISITENLGIIGIPIPNIIKKSIDLLNNAIDDNINKNNGD